MITILKRLPLLAVVVLLLPSWGISQDDMSKDLAKNLVGTWDALSLHDGQEVEYRWTIQRNADKWAGELSQKKGDTKFKLTKVAVDGKKLAFEFAPESEDLPAGAILKLDAKYADTKIVGDWEMAGPDAAVMASGTVTASKVPGLAGTWSSMAMLPDGNKMESKLMLEGVDTALTGKIKSENGEIKLKEAVREGDNLQIEFAYSADGTERTIMVNAKMESAHSLSGKWKMMGDDGQMVADGDWLANRDAEVVVLFDGSSLDHFRGYKQEAIGAGWTIEGDVLYFNGKKKTGDIVTKREFANFELEFEWKISEGGNSGVMYRSSLGDSAPYLTGPEFQILDDENHRDGQDVTKSAGSLYALYEPKNKKLNPVGEWNSSKIVLDGKKVEHWLNGTKVVDAEIGSEDWKSKVDASKFKTWEKFGKNSKGHLAFQDHGNKVWYRSIKVKVLK